MIFELLPDIYNDFLFSGCHTSTNVKLILRSTTYFLLSQQVVGHHYSLTYLDLVLCSYLDIRITIDCLFIKMYFSVHVHCVSKKNDTDVADYNFNAH